MPDPTIRYPKLTEDAWSIMSTGEYLETGGWFHDGVPKFLHIETQGSNLIWTVGEQPDPGPTPYPMPAAFWNTINGGSYNTGTGYVTKGGTTYRVYSWQLEEEYAAQTEAV